MRTPGCPERGEGQQGLTLIEMLVSLSILSVVFSGFAALLIGAIGGVVNSEHELRATAIATQAVEGMQALDWDFAAHYANEVSAAETGWSARLDLDGTYEGFELVELPAPPSLDDRVVQVPELREPVIDPGPVDYTVDRYVVWVDRAGDGTPETKRFIVHVTWESRGRDREISLSSERVPTIVESAATASGVRVLQMWVTPNPASLDAVTDRNAEDITMLVRVNQNVTDGRFSYYSVETEDLVGSWELQTVDGIGSNQAPGGDPGYIRWEYTIPIGSEEFRNGSTTIRFTALDADLNVVESFASLRFRGGGEDSANPEGPPPPVGSVQGPTLPTPFPPPPEPEDPDDNGDDDGNGEGLNVVIGTVASTGAMCVNNSGNYDGNLQVSIPVAGLTQADGNVEVTYQYINNWGQKSRTSVTDSAVFISQVEETATYEFTVPSSRRFEDGDVVEFDIDARNSADANDGDSFSRTVGSC